METPFLSAHAAAELIASEGARPCMVGMAKAIETDYCRWSAFDKSARLASHSKQGVIELMPISDGEVYAFKYVNGHPLNHRCHLPTVMAFGVLADVHTGAPLFVGELTLTTALRTAATSALVAQHLARPNCKSMAIIGNGAQSEFQALAFEVMLGIDTFYLYDTDPAASKKLAQHLNSCGLTAILCESAKQAVQEVDVITTATAAKTKASVLTPDMLRPGLHINAIGGDCPGKTELHPDVLSQSKVFVEYAPQTRVEGDVQQMPADFPVTEIWSVLSGSMTGRAHETDITVFDSVGFALEDFSALRFMHQLAQKHKRLGRIGLIPELNDPKNLYALITEREFA